MNSIKGILDKSDYESYDDFLNFQVDSYWLDEKLEEIYPGNMYKGMVPTLLFWMEIEKEREIVWNRILPDEGQKTICPILMCPDDADFYCMLIDAEIENTGTTIRWNRIGIDRTKEFEPEKIGSTVEWFDKVKQLEFEINEYTDMLNEFKKYFEIDKHRWEERNRKLQEEQKNKNNEHPTIAIPNKGFIAKLKSIFHN
jgi:hypothetical protein